MNIKIVSPKKAVLPIEYKSFSVEDFEPDYLIKDGKVTELQLENGRIKSDLSQKVDLFEKNTVVINAGVGQGKSSSCIDFAKQYYGILDAKGEHEYLIIFATPFVSILNQYQKLLTEADIPRVEIYNYTQLTTASEIDEIVVKPIHLITINSLLGNYGEEGFIQSKIKRNYLHGLIQHCENNKKKAILFFDEIHDGVESFKQKFIFNLWKWHEVIGKIFILSATFSESAKIIIKYLADLTEDKIHLLESRRVRISGRLVPLNICLCDSYTYSANDELIADLIDAQVKKRKRIHILSFSENLAEEMVLGVKEGKTYKATLISKILANNPNGEKVNLSTGNTKSTFNEDYWNVGTNFKTGINITKSNTSFFIILPPSTSYSNPYKKALGIFTNGSNTIVQGIARMRTAQDNEIFIIMPKPESLINNSPDNTGINDYIKKASIVKPLLALKLQNKIAHYYHEDFQIALLNEFHKSGRMTLKKGFDNINILNIHIKERSQTKPRLSYPDLSEFIMEDGDKYLVAKYERFGADLSSYVIWAAFNNQFENATLNDIHFRDTIYLKEGKLIKGVLEIYTKYLHGGLSLDYTSEKELFFKIYQFICEKIDVKIRYTKNGNIKTKDVDKYPDFKKALISVVKLLKRPTAHFEALIYPNGKDNASFDFFIDKEQYLKAALNTVQSELTTIDHHLPEDEYKFLEQYRRLYLLTELYKQRAVFSTPENVKYILKKEDILERELFTLEEQLKTIEIVRYIKDNDFFFYDDTFSFFQWVKKLEMDSLVNNSEVIKSSFGKIINELKTILYEVDEPVTVSRYTSFKNTNGLEISGIRKPYPIKSEFDIKNISGINLIYKSAVPFMESQVSEHFHIKPTIVEGQLVYNL